MDTKTKEKIEIFLREQMANTSAVAKQYTTDNSGQHYPKRDAFEYINAYADDFLRGNTNHSWCVITGLRGVGKTTILMQILSEISTAKADTLFLSVDKITELFGVSLADTLRVYEEITGNVFEKRKKPLLLFIDEAQYDKKWGITLKDVYDRARHKVFIYATGSAALPLSMNSDTTRRVVFANILPLSFTEYMNLKNKKPLDVEIQKLMQSALFESANANEVYKKILALEGEIKKYYATIAPLEIRRYIEKGSLPSALFDRSGEVFNACNQTLEKIIKEDIAEMFNFKTSTIRKASTALYMLASSDQVSYESFGRSLNLNRHTVKDLLDSFVDAGVLIHVQAYTPSHTAQVRQRSKFLFVAPVFRSAIFNKGGSVLSPDIMYGKLLEDIIGLTLHRIINLGDSTTSFLTHDAKAGGADFVAGFSGKKVVYEISAGDKSFRQVKQTAKRVDPSYSIVISKNLSPSLDIENNAVKIPLDYFLLA